MVQPLFAVNDVVCLTTGGPDSPEMLVEGPGTASGQLWCTWTNGKLSHGGSFDEKSLVRVRSHARRVVEPPQTPIYPKP